MAIKKVPFVDPVMDIVRGAVLGQDQAKYVRRLRSEDLRRLREVAKLLSQLSAGELAAREVRKDVEEAS